MRDYVVGESGPEVYYPKRAGYVGPVEPLTYRTFLTKEELFEFLDSLRADEDTDGD